MKIAVASGKGGTGKTLLSTNLAWWIASQGRPVTYVDCDVEAPNGGLFLQPEGVTEERVRVPVPALRGETCSGCGECQRFCTSHAIIAVTDKVMVFPELCNSCGGCVTACPEDALEERPREVGSILRGHRGQLEVVTGRLDVGEARAVPVIQAALAAADDPSCQVVDAPPGTSCNTVESIRDADHLVLVTEPTPFGAHDLRLAVEMARALGLQMSAVINRASLGGTDVRRLLEDAQIPVVAEVPFDREISDAYARGERVVDRVASFRRVVDRLVDRLLCTPSTKGAP